MDCHICGNPIDPAREAWEAEHVIRRILSKDDETDNVRPAHPRCHQQKTASDIKENAKGKRVTERHYGVKTSKTRPMPGSRHSDWKKRMNGRWERRTRPAKYGWSP